MGTIDEDNALLLDTVDKVTADLACSLLRDEEIPSYQHGPDFDVAELGSAAHDFVRKVSVYVPGSALEAAKEALRRAWGDDKVPD